MNTPSDKNNQNTAAFAYFITIRTYATWDLKLHHPLLLSRHKFWACHASTKNIWAPEKLFPALYYDKRFYDPGDERYMSVISMVISFFFAHYYRLLRASSRLHYW